MMYKLFRQFKFANLILIGYECDQSQFAYHDNDFKAERVF